MNLHASLPVMPPAPRGRRGLPPQEAEAVRAVLRRVRDERFAGNASALGKALSMTQSAISQILSRRNAPSYATAKDLAELLRVDVQEVLAGAALAPPPPPDAYPERASALARLRGLLSPEVETALRSIVQSDAESPLDEQEWIDLALRRNREAKRDERLRRLART